MTRIDYLPVGVRGHGVRSADKRKGRRTGIQKRHTEPLPSYLLVFDTETTANDTAQQLNLACYRYYALSWDDDPPYERFLSEWEDGPPYMTLLEEGLVYADDLPRRDPNGMRALKRYVRSNRNRPAVDFGHRLSAFGGIRLLSRSKFVRKLERAAVEARACICAFNFPFDISRLAVAYEVPRKGRCEGGFAFHLFEHPDGNPNKYHPRWGVYHLGPHKAILMLLPGMKDPSEKKKRRHYSGHLLDLSQLVYALTAEGHSLESACATFGVSLQDHDDTYSKRDVEHGKINPQYINYCRDDVEATALLYRATMIEYRRHLIDLDAKEAHSPATILKAYLAKLGIPPFSGRGISDKMNGNGAVAYYGGRADCRIRRAPVPVQPYDFKSQYPTVCCLLDLWLLLTAERIDVREQSPSTLTRWLDGITLDDCFQPDTWKQMRAMALIEPDGDILPVRARYSDHGSGWGIGVNHYYSSEPVWYSIPELIASKLLSGRTPRILRVLRFEPIGRLDTLRTVKLRKVVTVNPRKRDLFRACVEARRVEGCPPELGYFLKILINSIYGIFAEVNRPETAGAETVRVHGLDQFESETEAPEEAGRYFCAPIAALITGGGRLLLAMLERCVSDLGGTHLATDTDSMAIVASRDGGRVPCPGGRYRMDDGREAELALSFEQTDAIAERFTPINPYSRSLVPGSILALEDCPIDETTGERRELWGYAISAKRYCYYTREPDGSITFPKQPSEHGLGQYLDPIDPERRERKGKRGWIRDVWGYIVRTDALGENVSEPDWLDRPALRQHPISTPRMLRPLEALHPELGYQERPKPFGFMVIATPANRRVVPSTPFALVQPFSTDRVKWAEDPWINFHDGPGGQRYRIARDPDGLGSLIDADSGGFELFRERPTAPYKPRKGETLLPVKTFGDVLHDFITHPEFKSAASNGSPCASRTRGLLQRRHVAPAGPIVHLGKESNQLEERLAGLHYGDDDVQSEYEPKRQSPAWALTQETLRPHSDALIAELSGLKRDTVAAARNGKLARKRTRKALTRAADAIATDGLDEHGIRPPHRLESRLALYLAECAHAVCPVCGGPAKSRRATYCEKPGCKKAAYRARKAAA